MFVDYYRGTDFLSDGSETETWGLGAVQSFDDQSLDVYAALLRFAYSDDFGFELPSRRQRPARGRATVLLTGDGGDAGSSGTLWRRATRGRARNAVGRDAASER